MDYASLVAALPQATVDALSDAPQGITAAAQVEVARSATASSSYTERALWHLPPEYAEVGPVVGGTLVSYVFRLDLTKSSGSPAQLQVWADQVRAHFAGRQQPAGITDLVAASVREIDHLSSERGPDETATLEVTFTGLARRRRLTTYPPNVKAGLVQWFDADDLSTITKNSSNQVSEWRNKAPGSSVLALAQSTASKRPVWTDSAVNGRAALLFDDAASQFLSAATTDLTAAPFSVVAVVTFDDDTIDSPVWAIVDTGGTGDGSYVDGNGTHASYNPWRFSSLENTFPGATDRVPWVAPTTIREVMDGTATYFSLRTDGSDADASVDSETSDTIGALTATPASIDATWVGRFGSDYHSGYVCEILVYDSELSDAEFSLLHTYVSSRWT